MYLPTTQEELQKLGWDRPDIVLVTSDAYIDSPHVGVALIGKHLAKHGFKVGVIAQPSMKDNSDIMRLGEPKLFWGVTGGCIDSMVANYTPSGKWRKQDDYTPGGINARPDRATIAYTNLIRRSYKDTVPIVLGGIEASLRRVAHFDFRDNALRRAVLFDAKADYLAYGMAEKTVLELAHTLQRGGDPKSLKGLCYISAQPDSRFITLPSYEEVSENRKTFLEMFKLFYESCNDPAVGFNQKHGDRYLVHNPAQPLLSPAELDDVYALEFERDAHPYYKTGEIRALETIKQSITTHRGCFGKCSFCAIAVHQGKAVVSRSSGSIEQEAKILTQKKGFNGIIYDVGGPTANMYATLCTKGAFPCSQKSCLMPQICPNLRFGHRRQIELLNRLMKIPGIRKVFVSSGIRHDMVVADREEGERYIEQLVRYHVSGQIKLAPEHYDNDVLFLMNKPSIKPLMKFKALFDAKCAELGQRFFMTYYLMAAHPGCTMTHMYKLKSFLSGGLRILPEQVQIFTPTPSTPSSAMYYCETDMAGKQRQKDVLKKDDEREHRAYRERSARHAPRQGRFDNSREQSFRRDVPPKDRKPGRFKQGSQAHGKGRPSKHSGR